MRLQPLLALAALGAFSAASAQNPRNTGINDQPSGGSPAYREAVRRFLEREDPKVIGGKPAPAGAFPWQVSIGVAWVADPYWGHYCGGTLFTSRWVITAAHCVDGNVPKDVIVTAGSVVLSESSSAVRRNVQRIIVKSDFVPETFENDVALIQLVSDFPSTETVRPISLVRGDDDALLRDGAPLVVLGWGRTNANELGTRYLHYVEVPSFDYATCNSALSYEGKIKDTMFCAGLAGVSADACRGDSGGPLTIHTTTNPSLAGIVSWGEGCARINHPGVYTRVSKYSKWIADCMAKPEQCR